MSANLGLSAFAITFFRRAVLIFTFSQADTATTAKTKQTPNNNLM